MLPNGQDTVVCGLDDVRRHALPSCAHPKHAQVNGCSPLRPNVPRTRCVYAHGSQSNTPILTCTPFAASQFNDGTDFLNHQSATIMLQRLRSIVPPFAGRPAWAASPPFLDMDLFTVYTILHTCTMQVCPSQRGGPGDGAFGQCALDGLLAMMDQLDEADYAFLDPVVTVCPTLRWRAHIQY